MIIVDNHLDKQAFVCYTVLTQANKCSGDKPEDLGGKGGLKEKHPQTPSRGLTPRTPQGGLERVLLQPIPKPPPTVNAAAEMLPHGGAVSEADWGGS